MYRAEFGERNYLARLTLVVADALVGALLGGFREQCIEYEYSARYIGPPTPPPTHRVPNYPEAMYRIVDPKPH